MQLFIRQVDADIYKDDKIEKKQFIVLEFDIDGAKEKYEYPLSSFRNLLHHGTTNPEPK
jgi:hypothetical protein